MRKAYLYITLIASMLATYVEASPRLTVVAVVDGLTAENLSLLRPYWSQGGFRTLSEEAYQTTIAYPHLVYGGNETTATLMTGELPTRHGYSMDGYFARKDRLVHPLLEDKTAHGIGTSQTISSGSILAPTLTDRMRLKVPDAKIYAVGIHAETSVLLAGHAANACCWIDAQSQQWVATASYSDGLPSAAYEQNKNNRIATVANGVWTPRMDIPTYTHPTATERKKGFSYDIDKVLLQSPQANTLVIELALDIQKAEKLGTDANPDMILIELNTISPNSSTDYIQSAEQEDMYLRLNQDLGFLMEQLDRRIGRSNYQLLVIGRPILGTSTQAMSDMHMPVRTFSADRAAALTGTYLMALYGHERWVDGAYGQSIYLNRTLIEQKRLNLETLQRQVARFLMDFEGVEIAMPDYEVIHYPMLRASMSKRHTGDVVFMLQPGWQLWQDEKRCLDHVIDENPKSPLLLWSGTIRPMPQGTLNATDMWEVLDL